VGAFEALAPVDVEAPLKYHPSDFWYLTMTRYPGLGPCMVGSLTGAVASQRVTEACEGRLKLVGNQLWSAMAQACLTARLTGRAETKVGHSDPVVPRGRAIAQRIKGTPGITG
jgi:hypothetical protein